MVNAQRPTAILRMYAAGALSRKQVIVVLTRETNTAISVGYAVFDDDLLALVTLSPAYRLNCHKRNGHALLCCQQMTTVVSPFRTLRMKHGWSLQQVVQQLHTTAACLSDLKRGKGAHAEVIAPLSQVFPTDGLLSLPPGLADLLAHPDRLARMDFNPLPPRFPHSAGVRWTPSTTIQQSFT